MDGTSFRFCLPRGEHHVAVFVASRDGSRNVRVESVSPARITVRPEHGEQVIELHVPPAAWREASATLER